MRFLAGFLTGALVLVLAALAVLYFGVADFRADANPPAWLVRWLSASIHASVRRQASRVAAPTQVTDASVIAGGKLYLNDCAGCHGEPGKPASEFGATFYPPAPQLSQIGTNYTEAQIFWIAKHGIRRTGMGSQADSYSDEKLRQLAAFIHRMAALPPKALESVQPKPALPAHAAEAKK